MDIEGVGEKTKIKLLTMYGSVEAELTPSLAEKVLSELTLIFPGQE